MPSSTLPVRSALTSAVLVKMPPPALANSARELAPNEKPSSAVVSPASISTSMTPSRHMLTTPRPMTAPPRKPTRNAGLMPSEAARAARVLARVATYTPSLPVMADMTVPAT